MATTERFARFNESRDVQGGGDAENFDDLQNIVEQASMLHPIPEDNIGHKLLVKQGWQAGQGLGKQLQGRVEPIPIIVKEELMGFGRMEMELGQANETTERRRVLECEKENTEELKQKYKENQEKEKAKEESLADLKSSFYCHLCDKQYLKHTDYDNHIAGYDHAHKQRLKELNKREFGRHVGCKRYKEEKKLEKEMKRITEFAESRAQNPKIEGSETEQQEGEEENANSPQSHNSGSPQKADSPVKSESQEVIDDSSGTKGATVSFSFTKKSASKISLKRSVFKDEAHKEDEEVQPEEEAAEVECNLKEKTEAVMSDGGEGVIADEKKEVYHGSVAANCKVKPQFDFLLFVKSNGIDVNPGDESQKNEDENETVNKSEDVMDNKIDGGAGVETTLPVVETIVNSDGDKTLSFHKVLSKNEVTELDWPAEMIQYTKTEPKLSFSCNPLYFDFTQLFLTPKRQPIKEEVQDDVKEGEEAVKKEDVEKEEVKTETVTETNKEEKKDDEVKVEEGEKLGEEESKVVNEDIKHEKSHKKKKKKRKRKHHSSHRESDKENTEMDGEAGKSHSKTKKKKKKRKHKHKHAEKEKDGVEKDGTGVEEKDKTEEKGSAKKHKKKKKRRKSKKSRHSDHESAASEGDQSGDEEKKPKKDENESTLTPSNGNDVKQEEKTPKKHKKSKKSKKSKSRRSKVSDVETDSESEDKEGSEQSSGDEEETKKSKRKNKRKKLKKKKHRKAHSSVDEDSGSEKSEGEEEGDEKEEDEGKKAKKMKRKYRRKQKDSEESSDTEEETTKKKSGKKAKASKRKNESESSADDAKPTPKKNKKVKANSVSHDTTVNDDGQQNQLTAEAKRKKAAAEKVKKMKALAPGKNTALVNAKVKSEKMSDFEGEDFDDGDKDADAGKSKWDTSSDSELETIIKAKTKTKQIEDSARSNPEKPPELVKQESERSTKTVRSLGENSERNSIKEAEAVQRELERAHRESERSRRESERSHKESERSHKESERSHKESERSHKESDHSYRSRRHSLDSQQSDSDSDYDRRSRSRSRHRDSYSDSDYDRKSSRRRSRRSRSYSSDSDYGKYRRSRHSRSRSRSSRSSSRYRSSRRRRNDSYSSYSRSRSRSYSRHRSYSRSRRRRRRSYSRSYSRSDSSYSRSRSRSRHSRSYTRSRSRERLLKPSPDKQFSSVLPKKEPRTKRKSDISKEPKTFDADKLVTPLQLPGNKEEVTAQAQELLKKVKERQSSPGATAKGGIGLVANADTVGVPLIGKLPGGKKKNATSNDKEGSDEDEEQKRIAMLAKQMDEKMTEVEGQVLAAAEPDAIPLPTDDSKFIGPVLPSSHPLAHMQEIPLPEDGIPVPGQAAGNAKFKTPRMPGNSTAPLLPPPPPPHGILRGGPPPAKRMRGAGPQRAGMPGKTPPLPPPPQSPPPLPPPKDREREEQKKKEEEEKKKREEEEKKKLEDPEPMKMMISPEQAEQYKALAAQAQIHAKQRKLKEQRDAGLIPDEEEEKEEQLVAVEEAAGTPQPAMSPVIASPIVLQQPQPTAIALPHPLASPQPHQLGQPIPIGMVSGSVPMMVSSGQIIHGISPGIQAVPQALSQSVQLAAVPQAGMPVMVAAGSSSAAAAAMMAAGHHPAGAIPISALHPSAHPTPIGHQALPPGAIPVQSSLGGPPQPIQLGLGPQLVSGATMVQGHHPGLIAAAGHPGLAALQAHPQLAAIRAAQAQPAIAVRHPLLNAGHPQLQALPGQHPAGAQVVLGPAPTMLMPRGLAGMTRLPHL